MYNQQGDVLMVKVDKIPKSRKFKKTSSNRVIVAEGEVTGHNHQLVSPLNPINVYEADGETYVEVFGKCEIVHQEHERQDVLPGIYKIDQVREYDHFTEETRRVQD